MLLLPSAKYKPQWEAYLSLVLCFLPLCFLNLAAGPVVSKSKMKIPLQIPLIKIPAVFPKHA